MNKNLDVIKENNKDFYDKLINHEKETFIQEIKSNNGDPNFTVKSDSGQIELVYDYNNPRKPIRDEFKNKPKLEKNDASIIIGIGYGHRLRKILENKHEKHFVIVVEPILQLISKAIDIYDFTEWLKDGSLIIVTDIPAIRVAIGIIDQNSVIERWLLTIEQYTTYKQSIYHSFTEETKKIINQIQCSTGTLMGAGKEIARNDILNIPNCIGFPGGKTLFNKFKNVPAILVSTGPSLQKNIHIIKKIYEEKTALILAVGQALRVLLSYDIIPDLITTVDYGKINLTHFNGLMTCDVPLVALNRTHAELLDKWQGPKFIISTAYHSLYNNSTVSILSDKGFLDQGGSVSHFLLSLAHKMGCNPIVITGQDLALTDGKSHIINADSAGTVSIDNGIIKWDVKDKRSPELSKQQNQMGYATYVEGYFGLPVLTNVGLQSFITAFDHIIKTIPDRTIINSTQGGARISGAVQMSLSKVKELHCKKSIKKHKKKIKRIYKIQFLKESFLLKRKIKKAIKIIKKELCDIIASIKYAKIGLEWNKKIENYDKESSSLIENALSQNEIYSKKAHKLVAQNALLTSAIYHENREINGEEYKTVEGRLNYKNKKEDDFQLRLKRNKLILEAVKKEAKILCDAYKTTLKKLSELKKNKYKILFYEDKNPSLNDAKDYFKNGNWAIPYLEACRIIEGFRKNNIYDIKLYLKALNIYDQCIEMRNELIDKSKSLPEETKLIEYNELIREAIIQGKEKKDFETSMNLLNKAYELIPEKAEALWGRATVLCFFQHYQDSFDEYNKLLKIAKKEKFNQKAIQKFQFERALVLLNIDIDKALLDLLDLIKENQDFSYFLKNIARIYIKQNKKEKAIEIYNKYLKLFSYDKEAEKELKDIK